MSQKKPRKIRKITSVLLVMSVRWWNAEAAYAFHLAEALRKYGLKVWFLAKENTPAHEKFRNADFLQAPKVNLFSRSPVCVLKNYKNMRQFLKNQRIDVINNFQSKGSYLFSLLRRNEKNFLYFRTRGDGRPPKQNIFNRLSYSPMSCDGVVCVAQCVQKYMERLSLPHQKFGVVYYSCSALPVCVDNSPAKAKQALGIAPEKTVYCLLGRNQEVKGHMELLRAFCDCGTLLHGAHLLFLIKDTNEFPEHLEKMRSYLARQKMERHVTILGFQQRPETIFPAIDYGVIPSLGSEVNARVAVEFFSAAIPVIAFPVGSLPEIIQNEVNGLLGSEVSVTELRRLLLIAYNLDTPRKARLKQQALNLYQTRFTLDSLFHQTMRFWKDCLPSEI